MGGPADIVNERAAKEDPLALQSLPGIRQEVEPVQSLLEGAQLRFGPLMPRQALRQRLQAKLQFPNAHEVRDKNGVVPGGIGHPEDEVNVFKCLVRPPEGQFRRGAQLQDLADALEGREVRQENRRWVIHIVAEVETGVRAQAGGAKFFEDRSRLG